MLAGLPPNHPIGAWVGLVREVQLKDAIEGQLDCIARKLATCIVAVLAVRSQADRRSVGKELRK